MTIPATKPCSRCEGCGELANTDTREPWTAWTSLPFESQVAIRVGLVKPTPCDQCDGIGAVWAKPTPQQVLSTPMPGNDIEATTVRGYLVALLATLWAEGDRFSGKSPFGNSGWEWCLHRALTVKGYIATPFDEDGYVRRDADPGPGRELIAEAIAALGATA